MNLLLAAKVKIFGRKSIGSELARWRRKALKENGAYSFVSGHTQELEVHHGFHVHSYPFLALSSWNDWVMTKYEHRTHPDSFHNWERRTFKNRFMRVLVAETPIALYLWKYFVWHKWKGYSWSFALVTMLVSIFIIY